MMAETIDSVAGEFLEAREAFEAAGAPWPDHWNSFNGPLKPLLGSASAAFSGAWIAIDAGDTDLALAYLLLARARASALIRRVEG